MDMYGRTKLFNIMSSMEFNRRLQGSHVESFSCHPGVAKTDLYAPGKMDKDKLTSKACPLMTGKGLHKTHAKINVEGLVRNEPTHPVRTSVVRLNTRLTP